MQVIDAQVHLSREIGVDSSLFAMDAVGVDAVLIHEWSGFDVNGLNRPYRLLPNGAYRAEYPMAREAVARYPGRFAYMASVDRRDPELRDLIQCIAANPHQLCIRLVPREARGEIEALRTGGFDELLGAMAEFDVPLMFTTVEPAKHLAIAGHARGIRAKFPSLKIILDHCGMLPLSPGALFDEDFWFSHLTDIADLSEAAVKLSWAPMISREGYPYSDLARQIRRLVDLIGADRLMWASDFTQTRHHHSWAQALQYLQVPGVLTPAEQEWIFAGTAQRMLNWPQSPIFGRYQQALTASDPLAAGPASVEAGGDR